MQPPLEEAHLYILYAYEVFIGVGKFIAYIGQG